MEGPSREPSRAPSRTPGATPEATPCASVAGPGRGRARACAALARGLVPLLAALCLGAPAAAQGDAPAGRPDQIFTVSRGRASTETGYLTENGLDKVKFTREGREATVNADIVRRIVFGDVPSSFKDARTYVERGDWENAVVKFRIAATDGEARAVVQAAARLHAAEALLGWGALDPNKFAEAADEAERFVADHPQNREVPKARAIAARATWLSGDAAAAAALYRALFEEGAGTEVTTGYDRVDCLEAGLAAARCFLAAGDHGTARDVFKALDRAAGDALGAAGDDGGLTAAARNLQNEARIGEGFALLVADQASSAQTFFESQERSLADQGPVRFGILLGRAEAHRAQDEHREAQLLYAQVSALDHEDRDRVAAALVGLARCSMALADKNATDAVRTWLGDVVENYGATPAAREARELLEKL